MPDLKDQIKILPEKPGIYRFSDKNNSIIYIGKAKNLKKRVSSYFVSNVSHSGRIRIMVSQILFINYTVVESEQEALLLENSLIKKHQPRYNIRLKDGKTYPYIAIKKEAFPRVYSTRTLVRDGSEYFGPFVSGLNKNFLLDMLHRYFFIRTCQFNLTKESIEKGKFNVCLDYHIKLCKGPCQGFQSQEDYNQNIESVRSILKGKTFEVIDFIKKKMKEASNRLEFEKAAELKNTLEALQTYEAKSTVVNPKINNVDVFSIASNEKTAAVNYLRIANGTIIQTDTVEYKKSLDESDEEILTLAISEMRQRFESNSKDLIVPIKISFRFEGMRYNIPQVGDKKKLLDLSQKNSLLYLKDIEQHIEEQKNKGQRMTELLSKVQKDLGLKKIPFTIECFDNSNIQGTYPVAAMSVFKNGKPDKSSYRHFNIKTVEGPDDFASMEEVILRRYKRVIDENLPFPDLIVVDGGKGQLGSAYKSLQILNIQDKVDIIGIAKKLEEIFKPGDSYPLSIDKKSPTNLLIQHLRNEAHRFGITHHRSRRMKGTLVTELLDIEGIGKETSKKLLTHFKSVKKLKEANPEEIINVVGIKKAEIIKTFLSKEKT